MNGFSVPSRGIPYVSIHFSPALQCTHCPRSTEIAILDPCFAESFMPECPIHGYVLGDHPQRINDDLARKQQRESITRFVLYMYDSIGYVVGISPVTELTSIPGYELTLPADFGYTEDEQEDFYRLHSIPDEAWAIDYVSPVGAHLALHVVWSWDYDQFFLYRDAEQVNAPDHFPAWEDMRRKKREEEKQKEDERSHPLQEIAEKILRENTMTPEIQHWLTHQIEHHLDTSSDEEKDGGEQ